MPDHPEIDIDTDAPLDELVQELFAALAATEELPVDRDAGRWIGEAQAVAGDAASGGLDESVVRERVARVRELLDHVESTGHEGADERVERARRLAVAIGKRE
jgi:hypothetical protein